MSIGVGRTGCRRTRRMRANQIYNGADPIRSRRHRGRQDQDTSGCGRSKRKSEKKSICCRPHPRPPPRPPEVSVSTCDRTTRQPVDHGQAVGTLSFPQEFGSRGVCRGGAAADCLRVNVDRARGRAGSLKTRNSHLTEPLDATMPRCLLLPTPSWPAGSAGPQRRRCSRRPDRPGNHRSRRTAPSRPRE